MENNSQSAIQSQLLISSSFYAMLSESTPKWPRAVLTGGFSNSLKDSCLVFMWSLTSVWKQIPPLTIGKKVARVLSFKIVWIGAHSHPLKLTNAQKTAQHRTPNNGFAIFGRKGHVTPKITWQQSKCLLPRYLQVLFTKTRKNRYFRSISTVSLVFM